MKKSHRIGIDTIAVDHLFDVERKTASRRNWMILSAKPAVKWWLSLSCHWAEKTSGQSRMSLEMPGGLVAKETMTGSSSPPASPGKPRRPRPPRSPRAVGRVWPVGGSVRVACLLRGFSQSRKGDSLGQRPCTSGLTEIRVRANSPFATPANRSARWKLFEFLQE